MNWFTKKRDAALFNQWISSYHSTLYKHAFWMTGNKDAALDLVQEAFYQAWLSMDSLQENEKALAWLLTILRRAIYREQRCQYRHNETIAQLTQLDINTSQSDASGLLEIYNALENLSHTLREAFLLHHLHGYSYEEISKQLETPIGTVMSRISRARDALRKQQTPEQDKVINLSEVKRGNVIDG